MTTYNSDFLNTLQQRGFIHQCSDFNGLDALSAKGQAVGYIGFDCTAPSLHVGSLIQIMMLHWLEATENKAIALMGGGTTRVGDPSGRDETRAIRSVEEIDANKDSLKRVFAKFLKFGDGAKNAIMIDNADWLTKLNYIDMLRDVGRHFSVNRMLAMDSVKLRLEREQEMSFIEFNYMICQAYDFVEIAKRHGCNLQMGGSDQWGNIVQGVDLGRRMGAKHPLYALTTPLLTTTSGAKMGKTAAGAIWLNEDQLGTYDFWQFWRNTEDGDVTRFLKLFTTMPIAEIERLSALKGAEINEAKKVLATEVTALLHGREKAEAAAVSAQATFEQGGVGGELPIIEMPASDIANELSVVAAFVTAGLVASNGEAKRAIANNSFSVNDVRVTSDKAKLTRKDVSADGIIKLSMGKKKHVLIKPV